MNMFRTFNYVEFRIPTKIFRESADQRINFIEFNASLESMNFTS